MQKWVRPLRRACVAAAALALVVWMASRFGVVFIGGWSMAPTFIPGDLVVYRRGYPRPREGDAVLVASRSAARGFVHRVVGVTGDGLLRTRGDANGTPDLEASDPSDVVGVVIGSLRTGRVVDSVASGVRWCYNRVPIANMRR